MYIFLHADSWNPKLLPSSAGARRYGLLGVEKEHPRISSNWQAAAPAALLLSAVRDHADDIPQQIGYVFTLITVLGLASAALYYLPQVPFPPRLAFAIGLIWLIYILNIIRSPSLGELQLLPVFVIVTSAVLFLIPFVFKLRVFFSALFSFV